MWPGCIFTFQYSPNTLLLLLGYYYTLVRIYGTRPLRRVRRRYLLSAAVSYASIELGRDALEAALPFALDILWEYSGMSILCLT